MLFSKFEIMETSLCEESITVLHYTDTYVVSKLSYISAHGKHVILGVLDVTPPSETSSSALTEYYACTVGK